jgi:cobalt-zinc-cadmium efflux system outer membrane protein
LADLESLAVAGNPTIAAADALVRQQQGLWQQAGLYPNPTVGYVRTDPNQPGQSETQGVFLSQEFVMGGKLRLNRAVEQREVDGRLWQLKAQRERVLNDVRIRFYEALGAQEMLRTTRELEVLAERGVKAAHDLVKVKQGARLDMLQAEIQLQAVRVAVADAGYRHQAAWRQLATVSGAVGLEPCPLVGDLEKDVPQLEWDATLKEILNDSPLLRAQAAQVEAADFQLRRARVEPIPNVTVQLVVQHDQVQKFDSVSTLAAVPLPLFNRNQGNVAATRAFLEQQRKEYERVQLALTDQLAVAFRNYLSARTQAERIRKEILPRAKESLDLITKGYQLGEFDILRVLNARQTYFQSRLAHIDALTELHKLVIEIRGLELIGGLNPTEVGTALQTLGGAGPAGARNVLLKSLQEAGSTGLRTLPGAIQAGEK